MRRSGWQVGIGLLAALTLIAALGGKVRAWWSGGHRLITDAVVADLPADLPDFLRRSAAELAEMSAEPDNWKSPATPHLRAAEYAEHFIDLEWLEGQPIPPLRLDLLKHYLNKSLDPVKGGFLPHALQENYERLLWAFHQYRQQPESPGVQARIVLYAGWLAHYAEDAAMPLHTTAHYDGRRAADGSFVQKGIHAKIDGYPEQHGLTAPELAQNIGAQPVAEVWPRILQTIQDSFALVDKCYELDAQGAFDLKPELGREFVKKRARAGVQLTLDLWTSAWRNSATVRFPEKKN